MDLWGFIVVCNGSVNTVTSSLRRGLLNYIHGILITYTVYYYNNNNTTFLYSAVPVRGSAQCALQTKNTIPFYSKIFWGL